MRTLRNLVGGLRLRILPLLQTRKGLRCLRLAKAEEVTRQSDSTKPLAIACRQPPRARPFYGAAFVFLLQGDGSAGEGSQLAACAGSCCCTGSTTIRHPLLKLAVHHQASFRLRGQPL